MAAQPQTAGELPLEELLALYGYAVPDPAKQSCHVSATLPDMTLAKNQITEDIFATTGVESSADDLTPSVTSSTSDLLQHLPLGNKDASVCSSDEESDDISLPSNEEHKEIMVGSMYQAIIPPLGPYTYQEQVYNRTNEDQLLWRPDALPLLEVEHFLLNVQRPRAQEGSVFKQTCADIVRDNEQALYELLKCNFNTEEALRRLHFNVKVFTELCGWSEEECRNFEHGYKVYGKNFHLIQANKVRTRSVGECVEYYYMWKKSERHNCFTQQATRITRKKYTLQLGNMEERDQDGYAGEMDGGSNSAALLSCSSSSISSKLTPPLPQQSSLDLVKQDGELLRCDDGCPQNLFARPFPPPALSDQGGRFSGCGAGPAQLRDRRRPPGFFQFHEDRCGAAGDVTDSPVACGWDFTCCVPPLPHLMTSCPTSLHLSPCCTALPSSETWENTI
ncbi:mesoderm induction early response protein 2 isoform X2 [Festucalex cinctus]